MKVTELFVNEYDVNDIVTINGDCTRYFQLCNGKAGTIKAIYSNNSIAVDIVGARNNASQYGYFYFAKSDLTIVKKYNENQEEINMSNKIYIGDVYGSYRVAVVAFLDDPDTRGFNYRLYDDGLTYEENSYVVVKSRNHGFGIARIVAIGTVDEFGAASQEREVVTPIDMTPYENRIVNRKRLVELTVSMERKANQLKGLALYETLSEQSPELKAMLNEYKSILPR